jgi:hypothetical protein
MAPGCHERLDAAFLAWIFNYPERSQPKVLRQLAALRPEQRVVVLRNNREVSGFLASLL